MSNTNRMIAIIGPSCSGKTMLARHLGEALADSVTIVSQDNYYRDLSALDPAERERQNFDKPDAFDWPLFREQMLALSAGQVVPMPVYDFQTHTRRAESVEVCPCPFVCVEGLFVLYDRQVHDLFDTKVFVWIDDEISLARRVERDVRRRGRAPESVRGRYERWVRPMCRHYVMPALSDCDVAVSGDAPVAESVEKIITHLAGHARATGQFIPERPPAVRPPDRAARTYGGGESHFLTP